MAKILFDNFPAHGHYNGSFKLAKLLMNSGHEVCYACTPVFQQKLHTLHINSFLIDPFIVPPFKLELKEKGWFGFLIENMAGRSFNKKRAQIEKKVEAYDGMIQKAQPELIILDEHHALKSIFYWKYDIPLVTIKTGLTAEHSPNIPPFFSTFVPKNTKMSGLYVEWLWEKHLLKKRVVDFFTNMLALGNTTAKCYKYFARKYSFPFEKEIIRRRSLGVRFKNIPSLIFPPEAYDFPRSLRRNLFIIGPISEKSSKGQILQGRLKSIVVGVLKEKDANPETKLIYCSLGTVTGEYLKTCQRFFNSIARACERNPAWSIVLSVGTFFDISGLPSIPKNLYVFDKVTQVALLEVCDIVINHGGMNTIYECIMAEKPMIVFPLALKVDQNGNGARVVYHQIGLKGVIRRATPKSIERLINRVINKEGFYVNNVKKLKSKFTDKSSYALELIDRIIKEGKLC